MAKETYERLVDDLDGSEATQTVEFGVDGRRYSVDLNDKHATQLRDRLAPFLARASRVRNGSSPSRGTPAKGRSRAIRAWATECGVELAARGRVAVAVQAAYDAQDVAALYAALGLEQPRAATKRTRRRTPPATFSAAD